MRSGVKASFFPISCVALILAVSASISLAAPPLAPLPQLPQEAAAPAAKSPAAVAPPEVVASAVAAVASLGDEVVLGRYKSAIERMYPQWKERAANRMGGMEELEKQLNGVAQQMVQQGISMISCQPQGQPRSYQVGPGKKVNAAKGEETLVFTKWLVLVPTLTKFRIIRPGEPTPLIIESNGFQVALAEKAKLAWTFIDGSSLTVADLRSLFVNLPQDLELPPTGKRESR
jgi:hypothetical protein